MNHPTPRAQTPTRERIVTTAAQMFRARGVTGTGILEILTAAEAPRGSMYHHFPGGKSQLVEDALRLESARVASELESLIGTDADISTAIRQFAQALAASLEDSGFQLGCPITTAALELAAEDDGVRAVCADAYRTWQEMLRDLLLDRRRDADRVAAASDAELILSTIEGGLLLARAHQDADIVRRLGERLSQLVAR